MITGGPGVQNVEVLSLGKVVYPERARGTGRKPTVKVAVLVDENGNVAQARVKEGAPGGLGFNEAALDAARRSRFLPATQDGVPGKSWTDLNFEFSDPGVSPHHPSPLLPALHPPFRGEEGVVSQSNDNGLLCLRLSPLSPRQGGWRAGREGPGE